MALQPLARPLRTEHRPRRVCSSRPSPPWNVPLGGSAGLLIRALDENGGKA